MIKLLLFLTLTIFHQCVEAQDERYFRQLLSGELLQKEDHTPPEARNYHFRYNTPYYLLDINGDGLKESISFAKKDNEDWIEIYDGKNQLIYNYQFENKGIESELYRIELKRLNSETRVLLLHYFEGYTNYLHYQGSARIYATTIDNGNLKSLSTHRGAALFDESRLLKGHYHLRNYDAILEDLNEDGTKELVVKYRKISTVFTYLGNGKWKEYP